MPRIARLAYSRNSVSYFEAIRGMEWPMLLDSGTEYLPDERYSIVVADPFIKVITRGEVSEVTTRYGVSETLDDPLKYIQQALGPRAESLLGLPFSGGALGYVAYDFGRRYEKYGSTALKDIDIPELAVGVYDWAVVVDHELRQSWLVGHGRDAKTFLAWDTIRRRLSVQAPVSRSAFRVTSKIASNLPQQRYGQAFDRVKAHIKAGDCYQINLTQRFSASVEGDALAAYRGLRRESPAPYSAYLEFPFAQIVSSSPEQFVRVVDGHAWTKPIKGTRPRDTDPRRDKANATELSNSEKDRAENVMIVDLLRNDFGRVCEAGSVEASALFEVESFSNVHHLVSTVEGQLRKDQHAIDLFIACFPGGSITGAPKVRAMQLIDSIEPHRRSIYCGTIGYFGFDGAMNTNIVIRTLLFNNGKVHAWAGGGIVADSVRDAEYQESLDKAAAMLAVLENSD